MSWSMDRLQGRRRRFTLAIGWRRLSQLASASSRSFGPSSRGSAPQLPRPAMWITAHRRWCERSGRGSWPSAGRAGRASACGASSSACAGLPAPERHGGTSRRLQPRNRAFSASATVGDGVSYRVIHRGQDSRGSPASARQAEECRRPRRAPPAPSAPGSAGEVAVPPREADDRLASPPPRAERAVGDVGR